MPAIAAAVVSTMRRFESPAAYAVRFAVVTPGYQ